MLQNISSDSLLWLLGGLVGGATLLQMMLSRDQQLRGILREVVEQKMEWMKKKAKATHLASIAAQQIADEEAALKEQLADARNAEETNDIQNANDPFAPNLFD